MNDEKLRKKLGRNARKKALEYSWEKVAKQYLEVYKKAIKLLNSDCPKKSCEWCDGDE